MQLLPVHGQIACALVLAGSAWAAPRVVTPHESGPVCRVVADVAPGFSDLGPKAYPACTRVELP